MLEVYRAIVQAARKVGIKELGMPDLEVTVKQYVQRALDAPTKEERDRLVRLAVALSQAQDDARRLKKAG
jgi:hypothetical protein